MSGPWTMKRFLDRWNMKFREKRQERHIKSLKNVKKKKWPRLYSWMFPSNKASLVSSTRKRTRAWLNTFLAVFDSWSLHVRVCGLDIGVCVSVFLRWGKCNTHIAEFRYCIDIYPSPAKSPSPRTHTHTHNLSLFTQSLLVWKIWCYRTSADDWLVTIYSTNCQGHLIQQAFPPEGI